MPVKLAIGRHNKPKTTAIDPSSTADPMETHLIACIQESLSLCLFDNAIFLAERLMAEYPKETNVFLLATCYHRANQPHRTFHLLRNLKSPSSRYLFAVVAMHLGKLAEVESALMPIPSTFENVPHGAAGFHLLGKLYQMTNRHANAIVAFSTALKLDPMMWCAFEELCVLGAESETRQYVGDADGIVAELGSQEGGHVDNNNNNNNNKPPSSLSGVTPPTTAGFMTMTSLPTSAAATATATTGGGTGPPLPINMSPVGEQAPSSSAVPTTQYPIIHGFAATGFTTAAVAAATATASTTATVSWHTANRNLPTSALDVGGMPLVTPSPGMAAFITPQGGAGFPSGPPPPPVVPKAGAGSNNNPPSNYSWPHATTPNAVPTFASSTGGGSTGGEKRKFDDGGNPRKVSSKLFADPASVLKRMALLPEAIGTELDQRALAVLAATNIAHAHRNPEGQHQALNILRAIGAGFQAMAFYQCRDALSIFERLPPHHFQTGWVLCQVGRAHFELVEYAEAAKVFSTVRSAEPHRLKGMEYYSTVLWHMKKEIDLSKLAQDMIALDRQSPEAWCVMGNCFSLQKEHENSLRFFQRALQLNPNFPYAYTLSGHEYFANEDFEKGLNCYRNATRTDPRHYNAWFGMGLIYFRQEKYSSAEYHFKKALTINPGSSVLRCYWGMSLTKLERHEDALSTLQQAVDADPRNPLARFERASALAAQNRLDEALTELQALKEVAPTEASVYFQMGKILKRLNKREEAMKCMSVALDLQPPSADTNVIKAALDRVYIGDEEEEDEV